MYFKNSAGPRLFTRYSVLTSWWSPKQCSLWYPVWIDEIRAETAPKPPRLGADLHLSKPGGSYSSGVSAAIAKKTDVQLLFEVYQGINDQCLWQNGQNVANKKLINGRPGLPQENCTKRWKHDWTTVNSKMIKIVQPGPYLVVWPKLSLQQRKLYRPHFISIWHKSSHPKIQYSAKQISDKSTIESLTSFMGVKSFDLMECYGSEFRS